jgi:hypothetical protein
MRDVADLQSSRTRFGKRLHTSREEVAASVQAVLHGDLVRVGGLTNDLQVDHAG